MKTILTIISLLVTVSYLKAETVTIDVSGLPTAKGQIAYAIFEDPGAFPDGRALKNGFVAVPVVSASKTFQVTLPPGDYAVAVYFDENMNKVMDKNMLGIPKEKFGFSNNPTITIGAPNFAECRFSLRQGMMTTTRVKLIRLL